MRGAFGLRVLAITRFSAWVHFCLLTLVGGGLVGCFSERSVPMRLGDFERITLPRTGVESTREWLQVAQSQLQHLVPHKQRPTLITEQLTTPEGAAIDVYAAMDKDRRLLMSVFKNFHGLQQSAQAIGPSVPPSQAPPKWRGFKDVWIPIRPGLDLYGRLGILRDADGEPMQADCIIVLPGLLGDNTVHRVENEVQALHRNGFHVLALEPRAHGQTERFHPEIAFTWGTLESCDLLTVDDWLHEQPGVRRTGLIGDCWGANEALLAAWAASREPDDPDISPALRAHMPPRSGRAHFEAGILAFSPVLQFEELIDNLETKRSMWVDPPWAGLQGAVHDRTVWKDYPEKTTSLRRLIHLEFARSELNYPGVYDEARRYLRFTPYKDEPVGDKLGRVTVPVLIVQSITDPLVPAQGIAELMAICRNPNVAAVLLPGGGHIGVGIYARRYYYSLILNFFDRRLGPAAGHQ